MTDKTEQNESPTCAICGGAHETPEIPPELAAFLGGAVVIIEVLVFEAEPELDEGS